MINMFSNILVVCVGNICRSPFGEQLLKENLPDKNVNSAGIQALVGYSADEQAIKTAQKHNISLTDHKAQQLTKELCQKNDLILVMEKRHIEAVCSLSPESRGKTILFGHWLNDRDISDPYRKSPEAFDQIFHLIKTAAQKWVAALKH